MLGRKASALGMGALIVGGGVVMGMLASSYTSDSLVWHAPAPEIPTTDAPVAPAIDQASAGQGWARTAFDGGLRQCPEMNPEFLAACQTEMKKLVARPAFAAGSYGGPLLITKVEPTPSEDAWAAQDRLERPRPELEPTDFEPLPEPAPEPAFQRTPDNYPAVENTVAGGPQGSATK
ncbi:hypothetical protein SCH01S_10_00100 [Sphingomonas changbaiensis NBRC 104936]|uniref:Uncharacterized protein n=2 Tax=Sphingomonas changbaiensis TaxID=529705 RepID=A0A0E9MM35_9SPHN|nr:hypothetical protein SCH01S_10_00100 [Sphingomonas changbaiensis NBRC 104936]